MVGPLARSTAQTEWEVVAFFKACDLVHLLDSKHMLLIAIIQNQSEDPRFIGNIIDNGLGLRGKGCM